MPSGKRHIISSKVR